jgi:hypothetical protein
MVSGYQKTAGFFSILLGRKASLILKCLEPKFVFASVLQNSFALVFKMDHCCVVCCIALQI